MAGRPVVCGHTVTAWPGACDHRGRAGLGERPYPQRERLLAVLEAVRGVDAGAIARGVADKARIPEAIHEARVAAVKALG